MGQMSREEAFPDTLLVSMRSALPIISCRERNPMAARRSLTSRAMAIR